MDVMRRHAGGYAGSLMQIMQDTPPTAQAYLGLQLSTL